MLPGVQVLFAFLLAVPFSSRFGDVDGFERDVYFVALLLSALAVALLMAPSIQHRILFRREQKRYLVRLGSTLTIAGMTALALAIVLSLVLVAHFLFGPACGLDGRRAVVRRVRAALVRAADRAPHHQSQSRSASPAPRGELIADERDRVPAARRSRVSRPRRCA